MNSAGLRRKTRSQSRSECLSGESNKNNNDSPKDFFESYTLVENESENSKDPLKEKEPNVERRESENPTIKETEYFTPKGTENEEELEESLDIKKVKISQTEEKTSNNENSEKLPPTRFSENLLEPANFDQKKEYFTSHADTNIPSNFNLFQPKPGASKDKFIKIFDNEKSVRNSLFDTKPEIQILGKEKVVEEEEETKEGSKENKSGNESPKSNVANTEFSKNSVNVASINQDLDSNHRRVSSLREETNSLKQDLFSFNDSISNNLLTVREESNQMEDILENQETLQKDDKVKEDDVLLESNSVLNSASEISNPEAKSNILAESIDSSNKNATSNPQNTPKEEGNNSSKSSKRKSNDEMEQPIPNLNSLPSKENDAPLKPDISNQLKKVSKDRLTKRTSSTRFVRECLICNCKIEKGQTSKILACAHRFHEVFP